MNAKTLFVHTKEVLETGGKYPTYENVHYHGFNASGGFVVVFTEFEDEIRVREYAPGQVISFEYSEKYEEEA